MKLANRLIGVAALLLSPLAIAATDKPECIAPAKPGGGFDLTCKLAQGGLEKVVTDPVRVTYMPGGIGAVAYNAIVAQRPGEGNTIVAVSSGSLLALAQGKFGKYNEHDVKWLAAMGTDYGMVAVRADSPYKTLKDLVAAMKQDPKKVVFGASGTIGNQDWMKAALVARAAGVDHKTFRYVAFEGGGEALTALLGGHVQVMTGDASEAIPHLQAGKIRILAVMADKRLDGVLKDIPTAKEQGHDISWPIIRGFYMGPKVTSADYDYWVKAFSKMLTTKEFSKLREERGLFPFSMTGAEFDAYAKKAVGDYGKLVKEFDLVK